MDFTNYEGTAIDPAIFDTPTGQQQAEPDTTDETIVADQNEVATNEPETATSSHTEPVKYEIEGVGSFTADEIKEMKQGNLRQSDYTKKTQELAQQRAEASDALELYNYLKANPHIVEAMKHAEQNPNSIAFANAPTAENQMLKTVLYNQKALETDMKMNQLKEKYGDVDEIEVYKKAAELGTEDLEFVYKALSYDKADPRAAIETAKAELKAELEANKNIVSTIVDNKQTNPTPVSTQLTPQQKKVAAAMGLSEAEYAKWI